MNNVVDDNIVELVDVIHFFWVRKIKFLLVMLTSTVLIFLMLVAFKGEGSAKAMVAPLLLDKKPEAYAVIEVPQILYSTGRLEPITQPAMLISSFSAIEAIKGAANVVKVRSSAASVEEAKAKVDDTVEDVLEFLVKRENIIREANSGRYSIVGNAQVANRGIVNSDEGEELNTALRSAGISSLKLFVLSFVLGILITFLFAGLEKILLDYRAKYGVK